MKNINELENMIEKDFTVEEIADKFDDGHCAEDFGMKSNQCCEDADCYKCWIDCLTVKIKE